jgi:5-methylcytosine-specific restriction protein A
MTIYFQHVGEQGGKRDFPKTIGTPVEGLVHLGLDDVPELTAALTVQQRRELEEVLRREAPHGFQIWGIPTGARSVLRNLRTGDWLLLLLSDGPGGSFYYGGRVVFRPEHEMFDLSTKLWGEAKFPLIVLLNGRLTSYPWEPFRESFGYNKDWRLAGMTYRLTPERIGRSQFATETDVIRGVIGPIEVEETSDTIFADLLDQVELLQESLEGRRLLREHIIRERDPAIVRAFRNALRSYRCMICNFSFEETYGAIGKAFIEAHHVEPIRDRTEASPTAVRDLIPVCSNCHRMLHRKSPPYLASELADLLSRAFEVRHN